MTIAWFRCYRQDRTTEYEKAYVGKALDADLEKAHLKLEETYAEVELIELW